MLCLLPMAEATNWSAVKIAGLSIGAPNTQRFKGRAKKNCTKNDKQNYSFSSNTLKITFPFQLHHE